MNIPSELVGQMRDAATNGSPALVAAAGRLIGLGQAEREALKMGNLPGWFWSLLGIAAGVFIGARVQQAAPAALPSWVSGRKKG